MALREGSIMEGLFAMYCAAYLIDPNDGRNISEVKKVINSMRVQTEIRESTKTKGSLSVNYEKHYPRDRTFVNAFGTSVVNGKAAKEMVAPPSRRKVVNKYLNDREVYFSTYGTKGKPDFSQVTLKIALKEAEVGTQFGSAVQALVQEETENMNAKSSNKSYESLKKKVDTMVRAQSSSFFSKLVRAKKLYLSNNRSDVVKYIVDADGVGNESSAGEIKQDITISIWANGRNILKENVNFSLKSDAVTFHNAGLIQGMQEVFEIFQDELSPQNKTDGAALAKAIREYKPPKGSRVKSDKVSINALWRLILQDLPQKSDTPNTNKSNYWWSVLEKQAFGTGYTGRIQILELNRNEIREFNKDYMDDLKKAGIKLFPVVVHSTDEGTATPGNIYIMPVYKDGTAEKDHTNAIFKVRVRYESAAHAASKGRAAIASPEKLMSELGGKESLVHEDKYEVHQQKGHV